MDAMNRSYFQVYDFMFCSWLCGYGRTLTNRENSGNGLMPECLFVNTVIQIISVISLYLNTKQTDRKQRNVILVSIPLQDLPTKAQTVVICTNCYSIFFLAARPFLYHKFRLVQHLYLQHVILLTKIKQQNHTKYFYSCVQVYIYIYI